MAGAASYSGEDVLCVRSQRGEEVSLSFPFSSIHCNLNSSCPAAPVVHCSSLQCGFDISLRGAVETRMLGALDIWGEPSPTHPGLEEAATFSPEHLKSDRVPPKVHSKDKDTHTISPWNLVPSGGQAT